METTYPINWKAIDLEGNKVKGKTLTTDGYGNYGLTSLDTVICCLANSNGRQIKSNTLHWQCYQCKEWNHRKEIKCNSCDSILDKFKDE